MFMRRLLTLIIAAIAIAASAAAQQPFTAVVKAEGTLAEVIGDQIEQIESLVVEGPINAADFATMNKMTTEWALRHIDLSKARPANDAIPQRAFYQRQTPKSQLESIVLPEGLKSIEGYAFGFCQLKSIELPKSLTKLGNGVFYYCKELSGEVVIPDGITTIPMYTFCQCNSLRKVILPDGLTSIGLRAFFACVSLKEASLPVSLQTIGHYAFIGCAFTSVTIPANCAELGHAAFIQCEDLESMVINSTCDIPESFAWNCENLSHIELADGIKVIGGEAFALTKLANVTIPASVTEIGPAAFENYLAPSLLRSVYSLATVPSPGIFTDNAFGEEQAQQTLYVPQGSKEAYLNTTGWWNGFTKIVEIDMAGVDDAIASADVSICAEGGHIVITADDAPYTVYTTDGRTVATGRAAGTAAGALAYTHVQQLAPINQPPADASPRRRRPDARP